MRTIFILLTLGCLSFQILASTTKTQEVKGRVVDKLTKAPIEGVNITIDAQKTLIGTITDKNGEFHLWDVPPGMRLRISVDGYKIAYIEEKTINDSPLYIEMENKTEEKKKFFITNLLKNKKADTTKIAVLASE